ncbi:TrkH family potassium uptake protein [Trueperella pyogenes]|uniref:TrkH family potassium uptake protein n=1 Tax=Trueperella pyogenes TaxID=1661 RepID=UPI003132F391
MRTVIRINISLSDADVCYITKINSAYRRAQDYAVLVHKSRHLRPASAVAFSFLGLIMIGTIALASPWASARYVAPLDALFTATSAVCLTGLITVDTATAWSPFGQVVIMILIQLGGLGIMTVTCLLSILLGARLGLRRRLSAQAEGRGDLGNVRWIVQATILFTLVIETVVFLVLLLRFHFGHGYGWARAAWEALFHAISSFNNAGFALYSDNLVSFATDAWVLLPLAFGLIVGGLGFPVLLETYRRLRTPYVLRRRWSLTARFTLTGTLVLAAVGTALMLTEWNGALAGIDAPNRLLNAFFAGVSPRTAGFNAIDYADARPQTLLAIDILMFIGGGSGGTAGGIKITTLAVLLATIRAEIKGRRIVSAYGRSISRRVIGQALAVTVAALALVVAATFMIMKLAPQFSTDHILFEATSAFGTVGLSTGITPNLPRSAQLILVVLMFAGRVGPLALATTLAGRSTNRLYKYPEERPAIG